MDVDLDISGGIMMRQGRRIGIKIIIDLENLLSSCQTNVCQ